MTLIQKTREKIIKEMLALGYFEYFKKKYKTKVKKGKLVINLR